MNNRITSFVAGTLVHTTDGLVPIENIKVGDLVLSHQVGQSDSAFRPVSKVFSSNCEPVICLSYSVCCEGVWGECEYLALSRRSQIWVVGYDTDPEDDYRPSIGWTSADNLDYGFLISLLSGGSARVFSSDALWQTLKPDTAWTPANPDSELGFLFHFQDSGIAFDPDLVLTDFSDDDSFLFRWEKPEWEDQWVFRRKVHSIEVEGSDNYYVGRMGVLVRDA